MHNSNRKFVALAALVVIAAAILGYLAGHGRPAAASGEYMRTAFAASVQLSYPAGWQRVAAAPEIPGLSFANPVVLAPDGDGANAGLVTGQLPSGEPSPLPRSFVARMRWFPNTQEVDLLNTQAYMYSSLRVPDFDRMLTLYVVPNPGGNPTALACYASTGFSADMRTCGQIAATLTVLGQSQNYSLTPEPGYARKVSASIAALDGERVSLRRAMAQRVVPAAEQGLATRLAEGFANAAASLSALEPSYVAGQAQATLSGALGQARNAYTGLAAALSAESSSRYAAAITQVNEAEASVNTALESFALLGYE
jgi:hypothetical protein